MVQKVFFFLICCFGLFAGVHRVSNYPSVTHADQCTYKTPIFVFDFGGVIGGTDAHVVAQAIATQFGIPVHEALSVYRQSPRSSCEEYWQTYAKGLNKSLSQNWTDELEKVKMEAIVPVEGTLQVVQQLRRSGYRVAMLSNTTPARAAYIRSHGYYQPFDPVILSCDIGVKKPDKQAYLILLEQLCAEAKDCIFIDDKESNIVAAQKLGFDTIQFRGIDALKQELERRNIPLDGLGD